MQKLFNFDNIGNKIKTFAKWSCWIGIVVLWIGCFVMLVTGTSHDNERHMEVQSTTVLLPILIAAVGPFVLWIGSWMTYAFGELVEKTCSIANGTPVAGVTAAGASTVDAKAEKAKKLQSLLEQGIITEEEYAQAMANAQ